MKFRYIILAWIALFSPLASALDLLGVEIGSRPTAAELGSKIGIALRDEPGSIERMQQCRATSSGFFGARKYDKCLNEIREAPFPIPAGLYRAKPAAFNTLWGCMVDVAVIIDESGNVSELVVNFQSGFFPELENGAKAKWGAPTTHATAGLENAFGAKVLATEEHWSVSGGSVSLLSNYDMQHGMMNVKK